ncbi:MAG TPA: flavodoxin domain-containing protein [Anaerolineales bacterium]|nr:flavodoxin domain-containing protein [Anaerolineales bacterium]
MDKKVLIAFASKHGATEEIAVRISRTLNATGVTADLRSAEDVVDLPAYDAFVIGSAVYAGQWRKEAAELLESGEPAFSGKPVWLFSSGPTGEGDPATLMNGWTFPESLKPVAERIDPEDIAFFGGRLDLDKLNLAEKILVKGIKAPMGDFRDWEAIDDWAAGIASSLQDS